MPLEVDPELNGRAVPGDIRVLKCLQWPGGSRRHPGLELPLYLDIKIRVPFLMSRPGCRRKLPGHWGLCLVPARSAAVLATVVGHSAAAPPLRHGALGRGPGQCCPAYAAAASSPSPRRVRGFRPDTLSGRLSCVFGSRHVRLCAAGPRGELAPEWPWPEWLWLERRTPEWQ